MTQQFRTYQQANELNNSRWRKLRKIVLSRDNYLCQECRRNGRLMTGNEVDHIVPRSQGGDDELDNLQVLCRQCHAVKTSSESSM